MEPTIEPGRPEEQPQEAQAEVKEETAQQEAPQAAQEAVEGFGAIQEDIGPADAQEPAGEAVAEPEAMPEGEQEAAGEDVGPEALEQFATPDEEEDPEGVPKVEQIEEAQEEPASEQVEVTEGNEGEEAKEAAGEEEGEKKVTIQEALSDFNHELFWQAFNQEVSKVIKEGRVPKNLIVPKDRAHKLLLSAFKNFEALNKEVKEPEELVFSFHGATPEDAPEDFKPEVFPVRVIVSEIMPSSRKVDVMMLV